MVYSYCVVIFILSRHSLTDQGTDHPSAYMVYACILHGESACMHTNTQRKMYICMNAYQHAYGNNTII